MKPTRKYTDVLKELLFSLHSRRFLFAAISANIAYFGSKFGVSNEVLALIIAPLGLFILGESYKDGQALRKD